MDGAHARTTTNVDPAYTFLAARDRRRTFSIVGCLLSSLLCLTSEDGNAKKKTFGDLYRVPGS